MTDVTMKGGIPAKYIQGSPAYSGTTLGEIKEHFRDAAQDPKGLLKDIARQYLKIRHRPSTLLGE